MTPRAIPRLDRRTLGQLSALVPDAHQRDEMAAPSYLHGNPLIRWLFWERLACAAELLGPGPYGNGLDFGCGLGLLLPALAERTRHVVATDLELTPARRLKSLLALERVTFVAPDELEAAVAPATLDYVIATDSLEHVPDLDAMIALFARLLAPGGALVISGPTETRLYRIGRWLAGFAGKEGYHHTNVRDIRRRVESCGAFERERSRVLPIPRLVEAFVIDRFRRV